MRSAGKVQEASDQGQSGREGVIDLLAPLPARSRRDQERTPRGLEDPAHRGAEDKAMERSVPTRADHDEVDVEELASVMPAIAIVSLVPELPDLVREFADVEGSVL